MAIVKGRISDRTGRDDDDAVNGRGSRQLSVTGRMLSGDVAAATGSVVVIRHQ